MHFNSNTGNSPSICPTIGLVEWQMNDSDMRTSIALDLDLKRHWIHREIQSKWEQIQWPIDECVETLNKNYIELNDNNKIWLLTIKLTLNLLIFWHFFRTVTKSFVLVPRISFVNESFVSLSLISRQNCLLNTSLRHCFDTHSSLILSSNVRYESISSVKSSLKRSKEFFAKTLIWEVLKLWKVIKFPLIYHLINLNNNLQYLSLVFLLFL